MSMLLIAPTARCVALSRCTSRPWARAMSISRMLDMGGAPSAMNDSSKLLRTVNASKNSKLQAVAFDFDILSKSIKDANEVELSAAGDVTGDGKESRVSASAVKPDVSRIQQMASLLNIKLGESPKEPTNESQTKSVPKPSVSRSSSVEDIRAKYASKIKGGLAGVELAKSQVADTLQKGDAAGHLAARKLSQTAPSKSGTRWLAQTGTGKLLSYMTKRSIRIALLPVPGTTEPDVQMHDLSKQLNDVVIDVVIDTPPESDLNPTLDLLLKGLGVDPGRVLLISQRDDYLKAARDRAMITCRLRPKNARRGNLTAHYTIQEVKELENVVNEINGISFNAVIN